MILTDLATSVLAKLLSEAGTSEFWNATDIISDANWLYRDTAKTLECLKKNDVTLSSVVGTARYVIPKATGVDSIIKLLNVTFDGESVDFYTKDELDVIDYRWRSLGNGTPYGCFFAMGDDNVAISFVPAPNSIAVIGLDFAYVPTTLLAAETPETPFADGTILFDGLMSMQLAKEGGGRDLDRSDWWFQQFTSHFTGLTKHKGYSWHGFKSIEDSSSLAGRGVRLPSNYPRYSFDD